MPTESRITISDIDRLQMVLREFEAAQATLRKVESTPRHDASREHAMFAAASEKLTRARASLDSEAAALDARAERAEKAWSNH